VARKKIEIEIIGTEADLRRALGASMTGLQRFQRGLEPVARGARRTLLGLGVLGAAAVKLASDFERTSSQMVGLAGVGEAQVERWKSAMLDLAPVVGQAPNELAKALYFISSSGVEASKALDVLETSAKGATAGLGETSVVADAVTSAMNAYADVNLTASQAADVLTATVREGKGEASEIAPVLGNILPIASQLGVGFNEVGAAMASMTRLGFDAATAATNLSGVFNALVKPAKDSREALKDVGTSAEEVQRMLARRGLLATLQFLENAFEGNTSAIARVFRDVRGFRAVLALVGKAGDDTAQVFKRMETNTGALGKAFSAAAETDSFKFQQALAGLQAAGIQIGADLAPAVASAASEFAGLVGFLGDHATATQVGAVAVAGFATAIIAANTALKIYNSQLVAATIGQARLGAALGAAAGPAGLIALAAVGVGALVYEMNQLPSPTDRATDSIRNLNAELGAYASLSGAVNASAQTLAAARLEERASTIAVREAEANLNRVRRDSKSTNLDIKKAELGVDQARQRHTDAIHRLTSAQIDNRSDQQKQAEQNRKVADTLTTLVDRYREATRASRGDMGRKEQTKQLQNFTAELRNIVSGATQASPAVRDMAEDILDLTQKLGRVPTQKEIELSLTGYTPTKRGIEDIRASAERAAGTYGIDFYIRTHGSIRAPTGVAEGGARGEQHGGPVRGGVPYVVGEHRPELFVPDRSGYIVPRVPRGGGRSAGPEGPFELTITNWREGTGHIRRIGTRDAAARARRSRQLERMGSG
jgi:TP901 family phage tail tape measure protein